VTNPGGHKEAKVAGLARPDGVGLDWAGLGWSGHGVNGFALENT
jgi:hypothetical protein